MTGLLGLQKTFLALLDLSSAGFLLPCVPTCTGAVAQPTLKLCRSEGPSVLVNIGIYT